MKKRLFRISTGALIGLVLGWQAAGWVHAVRRPSPDSPDRSASHEKDCEKESSK